MVFSEVALVALFVEPGGVASRLERFSRWLSRNGWGVTAALAFVLGTYATLRGHRRDWTVSQDGESVVLASGGVQTVSPPWRDAEQGPDQSRARAARGISRCSRAAADMPRRSRTGTAPRPRSKRELTTTRPTGRYGSWQRRPGGCPRLCSCPASCCVGGAVLAAGGLDAAGRLGGRRRARRARPGQRPSARCPSRRTTPARPRSGGAAYVFGGGHGRRAGRRDRPRQPVGPLAHAWAACPVAMSDTSATRLGPALYVVGGYTTTSRCARCSRSGPGTPCATSRRCPTRCATRRSAAVGGADPRRGRNRRRPRAARDPQLRPGAPPRARHRHGCRAPLAHAAGAALRRRVLRHRRTRRRADEPSSAAIWAIDPRAGPSARRPAAGRAVRPRGGARRRRRCSWSAGATRRPRARRDLAAAMTRDAVAARRSSRSRWPAAAGTHAAGASRAAARPPATAAPSRPPPGAPPPARRLRRRPRRAPRPRSSATTRRGVYVPNSESNTRRRDLPAHRPDRRATSPSARLPQHVTPSWDLRTLWVTNDQGNSLTPIDPRTGRPGRPVPVRDPVQPLLHRRRAARDRRRRGAPRARLPRPAHDARCATRSRVPQCAGRRPHGLHRGRPPRARLLRVRRRA